MIESVSTKLDRDELIIETGKMAKQASAAVTIQLGGTVVLVTCVSSKEPREGINFLPLLVEYKEKTYAAGKIPGGFFKREGRPSEKEILTARLIDRPIRPLFPEGMVNSIQVASLVLSSDGENDSDILAVNGASAALAISDIPFDGPIACVRVGMLDGKFVLNPTFQELETSDLNLVVVARKDKTLMMEASAKELGEEKIEEALKFAKKHVDAIIDMQEKFIKKCGRKKRKDITIKKADQGLIDKVKKLSFDKLNEINKLQAKEEREEATDILNRELSEKLVSAEEGVDGSKIKLALEEVEKDIVRRNILEKKND